MITHELITQIKEAFEQASQEFNFTFVSPFEMKDDNQSVTVFGYILEYGSSNGMIVNLMSPHDFKIDESISLLAQRLGYYYSWINIEHYAHYNKVVYSETLKDWGRFN